MRQFAIFMVILTFFLPLHLFAQDNKKDSSEEEKAKVKRIEAQKDKLTAGLFTPIVFYGKFVDQNGDPVANVGLVINTETYSPNPLLLFRTNKVTELKSDNDGLFEYKGTGSKIIISYANVSLPTGYAVLPNNSDYFHYAQGLPGTQLVKLHTPDKDKPVKFTLRKKEKAEIISSYITIWKFESGGTYYVDMFKKEYLSENDIQKNSDKYQRLANNFRYCLKLDLSEKKEADNFIYSIKVSAPELLKLRKFENKQAELLKLPESGYDQTELLYEHKTRKQVAGDRRIMMNSVFAREIKYEPGNDENIMLFGKINDQYYAKIFVYDITPGESFVLVFVNSTPNNSIFEDDSDLRNEIGYQKVREIESKVKTKLHDKFPLLKDVIEAEKAKTPEPTK